MSRNRDSAKELSAGRVQHLARLLAPVFATSAPTYFRYEATARHAIRAGLCLEHWPWIDADAAAAEVVREVLRKIGARRPTWDQGQIEHVVAPENCKWCRNPIPDSQHGRHFCDEWCARTALKFREYRRGNSKFSTTLFNSANYTILVSEMTPRPCEVCGTPFKALDLRTRTCSVDCASENRSRFIAEQMAALPPRRCANPECGTEFQPGMERNIYCSLRCAHRTYNLAQSAERAAAVEALGLRMCPHCEEGFKPARADQLYCCAKHQQEANVRKRVERISAERAEARKTKPVLTALCALEGCGAEFVQGVPSKLYCSAQHQKVAESRRAQARRVAKGAQFRCDEMAPVVVAPKPKAKAKPMAVEPSPVSKRSGPKRRDIYAAPFRTCVQCGKRAAGKHGGLWASNLCSPECADAWATTRAARRAPFLAEEIEPAPVEAEGGLTPDEMARRAGVLMAAE